MTKAKQANMQDPYARVWEAVLAQQRKARFLTLIAGPDQDRVKGGLALGEALLLLIVEAEAGKSIGELATLLRLERSWVSRMITSLQERGFLETVDADFDRRIKKVSITRKGSAELVRILQARSRIVSETYKQLNATEQDELTRLLKKLADGLRAPAYTVQEQTHPIDAQLARISWVIGVVGDNMMGTGLSVTKYHLMHSLARRRDKAVSPSEVAKLFPVNLSSISRFVSTFEKSGLISRKESAEDGRLWLLQITQKGYDLWEKAHTTAVSQISQALAGVPMNEIKRLAELIFKATDDFVGKLSHHPQDMSDIRALQFDELKELADDSRDQTLQPLVETPPSAASRFFGFFEEGEIRCALRVEFDANAVKYRQLTLGGFNIQPEDLNRFLRVALKAVTSGPV